MGREDGQGSCPGPLWETRPCLAGPCLNFTWQVINGTIRCVRGDGLVVTGKSITFLTTTQSVSHSTILLTVQHPPQSTSYFTFFIATHSLHSPHSQQVIPLCM